MKTLKRYLMGVAVLLAASMFQQAHAALAIIAHPDNPLVGITNDQLKNIYLGKVRTFPNGKQVEALDQPQEKKVREKFNHDVLEMTEGKRKSYWARLKFTGKAKPPEVMDGDEKVRDWVATHPEALGYIDGKAVNNQVKVLLIIP